MDQNTSLFLHFETLKAENFKKFPKKKRKKTTRKKLKCLLWAAKNRF